MFSTQPLIKFVNHLISYFIFIFLIISTRSEYINQEIQSEKLSILYPNRSELFKTYALNENLKYRFNTTDFYFRSDNLDKIDILISIWIVGFILNEIYQLFNIGFKYYFFLICNYLDIGLISCYVLSYCIKFYTIILIKNQKKLIESDTFWLNITRLNESDINSQLNIFNTFYWLNADRFYWNSMDLTNIYEGFFSLGSFITISRCMFYLPASQQLGPLQIMLISMIGDIFKFIIIFFIIFLAYVISFSSLYWYYDLNNVRSYVEVIPHLSEIQINKFHNLESTFVTSFWALFEYGDPDSIKLDPFNNKLTESFGFLLYGSFHIVLTILLMNMLIAMLATSYESIQINADIEWKYSRSKLYMEFINNNGSLFVPFNLIPCPVSIYYTFRKIKAYFSRNISLNQNADQITVNYLYICNLFYL